MARELGTTCGSCDWGELLFSLVRSEALDEGDADGGATELGTDSPPLMVSSGGAARAFLAAGGCPAFVVAPLASVLAGGDKPSMQITEGLLLLLLAVEGE